MFFVKFLFWTSLFIVFYTYIGYGILLFLIVKIKQLRTPAVKKQGGFFQPEVALIISAYNEEDFIESKIKNTLQLDYPSEKLDIIFITDGSTDRTSEIVSRFPGVRLLHQPERQGKGAAMNRAVKHVTAPFIIFCDANTLLNKECVSEMARHYADAKVGGVAGEKVIMSHGDVQAAAAGEGLYWKYESLLKRLDAELYSVVGAAGELFSVRKELYEPIKQGTIIEDFVLSLRICMKGHVIKYEPNAYAMETGSVSMKDEQKRKVRICAGAFQAMGMVKELFNVFRYPVLSFQFISHRILRWTLSPVCLVLLLLTSFILAANGESKFYGVILIMQLVFYFLALIGWAYANKNVKVKALYIPYYFFFMNFSVFLGFSRFINNNQSVLWEKAGRAKIPQ